MPRKHNAVQISEDEFWNDYKPIAFGDGDEFIIDHDEAVQHPRDMVWSIVESGTPGDERLFACPGFRVVNVVGYVLTEKFWESELLEAVYDEHKMDD